jgi:hypothetical protein
MLLEEHYSKIEHQNRLLLSRMSDIMTRPVGGGAAPGAGGVDNVCLAWEYGRSMNSRNRKAEIERINAANKVRGRCSACLPACLPAPKAPTHSLHSPSPLSRTSHKLWAARAREHPQGGAHVQPR